MTLHSDSRLAEVASQIARCAPEFNIDVRSFEPIGSGLEFEVYGADTANIGQLAIKVARSRVFNNDNDQDLDARDVLNQEAFLLRMARAGGIPTPDVYGCYFQDDGIDALILSRIPTDGSSCGSESKGTWLKAVHSIRPPAAFRSVAQRLPSLPETLALLVCRRMDVVRHLTGAVLPHVSHAGLVSLYRPLEQVRSLLHMDYRNDNLLCSQGELRGVVDWSNALIADPVLELARIYEFGDLDHCFLRAYGNSSFNVYDPVVIASRMYTATMLAVVFLSECPDPEKAQYRMARLREGLTDLSSIGSGLVS